MSNECLSLGWGGGRGCVVADGAGAPSPPCQRRAGPAYPDARIELNFTTPLELLVAAILSARSTDRLVNQVTPVPRPVLPRLESAQALDVPPLWRGARPWHMQGLGSVI
jgi:hypothetical protein